MTPTTTPTNDSNAPAAGGQPGATAGLTSPATDGGNGGGSAAPAGYVSAADVERIVNAALAKRTSADNVQADAANTRERFIREKMADLPLSVQNLMPRTGDPAQLAAGEQKLRGELREWAQKSGFKMPDVGGRDGGGVPPIQTMNKPAGSPVQRLAKVLDADAARSAR